jgi:hypothetical protein
VSFSLLSTAIATAGGCAWVFAFYLGPVVSLLRSPFGRHSTIAVGMGYIFLVMVTASTSSTAQLLHARLLGDTTANYSFIGGLFVPLAW